MIDDFIGLLQRLVKHVVDRLGVTMLGVICALVVGYGVGRHNGLARGSSPEYGRMKAAQERTAQRNLAWIDRFWGNEPAEDHRLRVRYEGVGLIDPIYLEDLRIHALRVGDGLSSDELLNALTAPRIDLQGDES